MAGIIDFHTHYIPREIAEHTAFFKVNWSDIDRLLKSMDAHNIEKAFLFYPSTDAHVNLGGWGNVCRIYNQKIADVVSVHPDRLAGAGIVAPDNPSGLLQQLQEIKNLGLKVLSLSSSYDGKYLDEEIFFPVYEFASREKIPIHVHPQIISPIGEERVKDPLLTPVLEYMFDVSISIGKMMMSGVFDKFHNVDFIFAHYGGVIPFVKERFDNTYQMLRGRNFVKDLGRRPSEFFANLYFDTSGSRSAAALACALEVAGSSHIVFGSDFPANQNTASSIEVIQKALLSDAEKQAILGKNAQKFLLEK